MVFPKLQGQFVLEGSARLNLDPVRGDWIDGGDGSVEGGFPKKVAVLLDFVQFTSPPAPPPPNLDNLYHFF